MDTLENNQLYTINELAVLLSTDLILIFSDYTPSAVNRHTLGYLYLTIFYITATFNLYVVAKRFYIKVKRWFAERSYRKKVQEALKQREIDQSIERRQILEEQIEHNNELRERRAE